MIERKQIVFGFFIKIDRDETRAPEHIFRDRWDMVIGNLKTNKGYWLVEPYGEGKTSVTQQVLVDPGGYIPDFIVNLGTKVTMPNVIQAVREMIGNRFFDL